jgi:predicted ATPase
MAHKLHEFSIAGYKSIRDQKVELRDLNILIGANGAGKSNFISAFRLLHDIIAGQLATHVARQGGANKLLHFGRRITPKMSFKLDFGPNGYELTLEPTINDTLYFETESALFESWKYDRPYKVPFGPGHLESQLIEAAKRNKVAEHVFNSVESWRVFHFHDTSDAAPCKQKQQLNDNLALRGDAQNLAAFLYRMREQGKQGSEENKPFQAGYRQIVATIKSVAPFFDDFVLEPDPIRPDTIQLAWKEKNSDEYFGASALSDGTLRFICLATLLLQPAELLPTTILLDEPELGLHPFAIQKLAAMIRSAATHAQIIVSTQSVTLMNQFEPEDVIVVDREDGASTFRRIGAEEVAKWADDYAIGELWEKNVIGGRPQ